MVTTNRPSAFIGVRKNRKRIYEGSTIYLENGQEFEIELHNPTQHIVAAKIWLNGQVTSHWMLVMKPGERIWLDRYLDENRKFLFETYKVQNTQQNKAAIANNGTFKVQFFKEKVSTYTITTSSYPNTWTNLDDVYYTNNTTGGTVRGSVTTDDVDFSAAVNYSSNVSDGGSIHTNSSSPNVHMSFMDQDLSRSAPDTLKNTRSRKLSKSTKAMRSKSDIETGRVKKGGVSNQEFATASYDFESYPFHTVEYNLIPVSEKKILVADEIQRFCVSCGMRIRKTNWKYCPACGEDL